MSELPDVDGDFGTMTRHLTAWLQHLSSTRFVDVHLFLFSLGGSVRKALVERDSTVGHGHKNHRGDEAVYSLATL